MSTKTLILFILGLWCSHSTGQGFTPGPTLTAATPYAASAPQPTNAYLFADDVEQSAETCRIRKLPDGSACVDCDLSKLVKLGPIILQMQVADASGVRSDKSAPFAVTLQKRACMKPAADGSVTCTISMTQPLPLASGACTASAQLVWMTPTSGTFTMYRSSGGALQSVISGKKAPASAQCACSMQITLGSATYCPLVGGNTTEVTLCQKR